MKTLLSGRERLGAAPVFDVIREAFDALAQHPRPLCLDGARFDGLPRRWLTVVEIKDALFTPGCAAMTWDPVWAELVARSRSEGGEWSVACAGLARPTLLADARRLAMAVDADAVEDVHAAVVHGFVAGLATIEVDRPWIVQRLGDRARAYGRATVRALVARPVPTEGIGTATSAGEADVAGHPDLVLEAAVADGALSGAHAELIAATRLERRSLAQHARETGASYQACRKARSRAERALLSYLRTRAHTTTGKCTAGADRDCRVRLGCPSRGPRRTVQECGGSARLTAPTPIREDR